MEGPRAERIKSLTLKLKIMKKIIFALSLTGLVMVSCKNKTIEAIDSEPVLTGYETMYESNSSTDRADKTNVAAVADMGKSKVVVKTVYRDVYRDNPNNNTTATTTTKKKKGWSGEAKGAVIGAGSGAILGAIVSKNKGTGAVLGGLIGAGAGYVVGDQVEKRKERRKNQ